MNIMKIGCIILAGGKSSRMGEDKALLNYNGQKFIEKVAEELSLFEEKIIARGNNSALTELVDDSWVILPDAYPDHGPIGGLHAALKECKSEAMFCVSCDIPLITKDLAGKMCAEMMEDDGRLAYDAVVAVTDDGKVHPLCGVYRKDLYRLMEEFILKDNNRLMAVLRQVRVKYVNLDTETSMQLANINTKKEYEDIKTAHIH